MYIWEKVAAMDDRRSQNVISAFPRLDIIVNLIFPEWIMTHCMLHTEQLRNLCTFLLQQLSLSASIRCHIKNKDSALGSYLV